MDRVGQPGDLGRGQEPHLLPLDLGQRHPPTRRLREHPGIDRRAHDLAEELIGLLHRRRRQRSGAQLGHPGAHVALADRGQRSIPEPGQGKPPQERLVSLHGRRPQVGRRRPPLPQPVPEQHPPQRRVGPGAPGLGRLGLAQEPLSIGLAGEHLGPLPTGRVAVAHPVGGLGGDLRPPPVPIVAQVLASDPNLGFADDDHGWYLVDHATGTTYRSPRDDGQPADYAYLGRLPRIDGRGTFLDLRRHPRPRQQRRRPLPGRAPGVLYGEVRTGRFSTIIACRFDPDTRQVISSERVTPLYRADTRARCAPPSPPSRAAPTLRNEDWAGVLAPGLAVVLDGLSAPDGTGTGCRHGTPWYVSQLGPRVLTQAADPTCSLVDALAEAIWQVASLHPGCDLTHPGTPSATLVLLRALDEGADYLALADAALLLDTADGLKVSATNGSTSSPARNGRPPTRCRRLGLKLRRRAQLTRALRRTRNRPGGYWVAAADPQAASQAVTGTLPSQEPPAGRAAERRRQPAGRPVRACHLEELVELLEENCPDELLRQVRAAEAVDPEGRQWPRTKRSDDATAIFLVLNEGRAALSEPVPDGMRGREWS